MRKLTYERLFALKQYENLKLIDEIDLSELNLGKEVVSNTDLYNQLRYLQFIQTELSFRKYLLLLKELNEMNLEDSIKFLETQKVSTIDLIKQIILERIQKE